jgi:hypothetical protein
MQLAKRMAGTVQDGLPREAGPNISQPEPMDNELGQLKSPGRQVAGGRLLLLAMKEGRVEDRLHGRARARRADDRLGTTVEENSQLPPSDIRRIGPKSRIEGGLPAAGLTGWVDDLHPQAAQEPNRRLPNIRNHLIDVAGDEKRHLHQIRMAPSRPARA